MTTLFVAPAGDRGLNTQLLTGARFLHLRNVFLPINLHVDQSRKGEDGCWTETKCVRDVPEF